MSFAAAINDPTKHETAEKPKNASRSGRGRKYLQDKQ
jgi:hypothetical protein